MSDTDMLDVIYLPVLKRFKKAEGNDWLLKHESFCHKLSPAPRLLFTVLNFYEKAALSAGDLYVYGVFCQEHNCWHYLEEAIAYFKLTQLGDIVQAIQSLLMADRSGRNSLALYAFKQIHIEISLNLTSSYQQIAAVVRQRKEEFFEPNRLRKHRKKSLIERN